MGSVGIGFFTVPIGCTTVEPIELPLSITEPVNALVAGGFSFKTEVTVPAFGGCGLFGPILSATMSGPGNTIEMTASAAAADQLVARARSGQQAPGVGSPTLGACC